MIIGTFLAAVMAISLSGLPGLWLSRKSTVGEKTSVILLLAGVLIGATAVIAALGQPSPPLLSLPWQAPGGAFVLAIDGLSAVFLLPTLLISGLGAIYGLGYWSQRQKPGSGPRLRFFYGLLAGAMALLLATRNGILFLVAWEVMALAAYFLIIIESEKEEVRKAGFLYLIATHTGTLALFALFTLLDQGGGSLTFPPAASLTGGGPLAAAVFLLAIVGFGIKAGLIPLHIWLPGAHAAAPSHVSALLSGVMIKMGIYGLVRVTSFFATPPAWWGWTLLAMGMVSGVVGVALALAQHDIKRLLAYHSVENIGIIAIGLGLALLGRSYANPAIVVLGLAGALLHVINHSLFKSLLFYSTGAVIQATGTREIDRYGGLLRRLPATGFFFLGGAVAICGLPPLNGFVSEWLIYLGLLKTQQSGFLVLEIAVFAAPALALIGGLAVACFTKIFGVSFLGEPRAPAEGTVGGEAPPAMLFPMGSILACCLLIGLLPPMVLPLLHSGVTAWLGRTPGVALAGLAPAGVLNRFAILLLLLLLAVFLLLRRQRQRETPQSAPTWDCGSGLATPRLQYTASSFAESLVGLFHWGLWTRRHYHPPEGLLPAKAFFASHTPDVVLDLLILPLGRAAGRVAGRVRSLLQHGLLNVYLLYIALALLLVLIILKSS